MRIIVHLLFIILSLQLVGCNSNRFVQVSAAVVLVDHEDIGLIAQKVCASSGESDDARIGHISTISKLKGFFEGIEKDHPLYDCYSKNKDSLELLERIVTKYNENVCSNEKVDLIEEYHNLHIETEGKPKNVPAASLRVFFMNYAFEISFRCYAVFSENFQYSSGFEPLNGLPEAFERGLGRLDNGSIKHILSRLTEQFDGRFWMARYDDALMVGGIPRASILKRLKKRTANQEFNDELDPITGQRIRIKLLVGSSDEMDHLKDRCRNSMKPIYSKLTLPIVRLSSLGYAIRGERFERELKELKDSKDAAGWYAVTKLCELILSIRFYENPSIVGVNGGVVVLDKEKEDEIKRKLWYTSGDNGRLVEEEQPIRFQVPVPASMVDDDVLQLAAENDEQTLVKKIELNLKDRNRACGRHLRVPSLIFLD